LETDEHEEGEGHHDEEGEGHHDDEGEEHHDEMGDHLEEADQQTRSSGHGHGHGSGSCDLEALEDYNLPLHIGSIFILMAVSAVPFFTPIILRSLGTSATVTSIIKLVRTH
jgi:zinc transporter 1/2/3